MIHVGVFGGVFGGAVAELEAAVAKADTDRADAGYLLFTTKIFGFCIPIFNDFSKRFECCLNFESANLRFSVCLTPHVPGRRGAETGLKSSHEEALAAQEKKLRDEHQTQLQSQV